MADEMLVEYLPYSLDMEFKNTLTPGEQILVSLPGSMGEALAVTDKRAVVVREEGASREVKVYSYPLGGVTGALVEESSTGGIFRIAAGDSVPEEARSVYFPALNSSKFRAAAEKLTNLVTGGPPAPQTQPQPAMPSPAQTAAQPKADIPTCRSCGSAVSSGDAFCAKCGAKVKDTCQICSGRMPEGAKFCPNCGFDAMPVLLRCPKCGTKVNSSVMWYCSGCGVALQPKCAGCGTQIIEGWTHCRTCGREIGAEDGMRGRAVAREAQKQQGSVRVSALEPEFEPVEEAESPAAKFNAQGTQLFDQDKVKEAIEAFRRAIALEPDNSSYHCNLAVAYDEADQDDGARREYERALELNPKDTTALLYLGYLLNENDEGEQAAAMWTRLVSIAPGTQEAEEASQNLKAQETL